MIKPRRIFPPRRPSPLYVGQLHHNIYQSLASKINHQASITDLLRGTLDTYKAASIMANSGTPQQLPDNVTPPTIDPGIANWLQLHSFDFESVRVNYRGAWVYFWRVTRHNDPKRPKHSVDIPLHYGMRQVEIRVGRVWPEII